MGRSTGKIAFNYRFINDIMQTGFMKYFYFLLLISIPTLRSIAQDTISINITNQYKQKVDYATLKIKNLDFMSDKKGKLIVRNTNADSVTVVKEGYKSKTISFAEVVATRQIVMEKEFSWIDLLTPMFYILYGGIWLLLFIIFAETGLFIVFF